MMMAAGWWSPGLSLQMPNADWQGSALHARPSPRSSTTTPPMTNASFHFEGPDWLDGTSSMLRNIANKMRSLFPTVRDLVRDSRVGPSDLPLSRICHKDTSLQIQMQPLDIQILFAIIFQLVNGMFSLAKLDDPQTATDRLNKKILQKFYSLPAMMQRNLQFVPPGGARIARTLGAAN